MIADATTSTAKGQVVGPVSPSPGRSIRLVAIDVLRGIAALAVLLFHATDLSGYVGRDDPANWAGRLLSVALSFGFTGVYLFFVVSGFCIHLRQARAQAAGESSDVDFAAFWRRRIRRLYPPYLAALVAYVVILLSTGKVETNGFFWYDISTHIFMVHNLDARTAYSLNGVFWTLALEEQLYAGYFVLLAVRRRYGWRAVVAMCVVARLLWFALALVLHRSLGVNLPVTESMAAQWVVWSLGALSVEIFYGLVRVPHWMRSWNIGLLTLAVACGGTLAARSLPPSSLMFEIHWVVSQPLWGFGFFIVLNALVRTEPHGVPGKSGLWRGVAYVGTISYSLYLTHEIVLDHLSTALFSHSNAPGLTALVNLIFLCPASIALAWLFFHLVEKHFLPQRSGV